AKALGITAELAVLTMIFGAILGIIMALFKTSGVRILYYPVSFFIEIVRAVPPLVSIVWFYYCLPIFFNISFSSFVTSVVALSIYSAAFYAEIFRAGIQAVDKGYVEASYAVGMRKAQTFRRIVGP